MKILMTNIWLDNYAGTEVYIRDLAIALANRGVKVEVYSPKLGRVAKEISRHGIHVCNRIKDVMMVPDLIHAQHLTPSLDALNRFVDRPAIYVVHDKSFDGDMPPHSARIMQYLAVDKVCREKILDQGIDPSQTKILLNWVDIDRFEKRHRTAVRLKKALVFSNYAKPGNHYDIIAKACRQTGLQVDVIGKGFGNDVPNPEKALLDYDVVFAKGKAAIESLATGAAVIVCDYRGLGGMVLPENYRYFRENNFGMNTMTREVGVSAVIAELNKYDAQKIEKTTESIRVEADFSKYVDDIVGIYQDAIARYQMQHQSQVTETEVPVQNPTNALGKWLKKMFGA